MSYERKKIRHYMSKDSPNWEPPYVLVVAGSYYAGSPTPHIVKNAYICRDLGHAMKHAEEHYIRSTQGKISPYPTKIWIYTPQGEIIDHTDAIKSRPQRGRKATIV